MKTISRLLFFLTAFTAALSATSTTAFAGEANLLIPAMSEAVFPGLGYIDGFWVLVIGLLFTFGTLGISLYLFFEIKKLEVHKTMSDVADTIYATCCAYLFRQIRFLAMLFTIIAGAFLLYVYATAPNEYGLFGVHDPDPTWWYQNPLMLWMVVLMFAFIGMAGSTIVAWYGIRINTYANARTAFASLKGNPWNVVNIPLRAGMSVGIFLISFELVIMVLVLLMAEIPKFPVGICFLGFAIGEALGASALRIAGGIFTKIADIGSDLMKIVFKVGEDDPRNPGVIADCTGDNAGDSVGPTADGFETYGVTGVALIAFIALAITPTTVSEGLNGSTPIASIAAFGHITGEEAVAKRAETLLEANKQAAAEDDAVPSLTQDEATEEAKAAGYAIVANIMQALLIVWLFFMRMLMGCLSGIAYFVNQKFAMKDYVGKTGEVGAEQFEKTLTHLIWICAALCITVSFLFSGLMLHQLDSFIWLKLAGIVTCGTLAAVLIPEFTKIFTSASSKHVQEVVTASREGGASLNILSGITAGNYSAFWTGGLIAALMATAYGITQTGGLEFLGPHFPIFAFGLVAFGFLGMGPVTIAVDSYGPVTDNAQSIFELSQIESKPGIKEELQKDFGFSPDFALGKHYLEANDGAGNTFKATAKPVLIGTAVAGATTMIFAIILMLEKIGIQVEALALTEAPVILGLIMGGAVVFWFSGASTQAVVTGAYEAVEFIKRTFDMNKTEANTEDAKEVVRICTKYAQNGMWNIFLALFFMTLGFSFIDPTFFVAYLVSIAIFGLFQAIYMANAGGSWDNAKKVVEVDLKEKGSELHDASVIGDTVGDPFKDTSSVSLNPIIKFSTLLGLLAVEVAVIMKYVKDGVVSSEHVGDYNVYTLCFAAAFLAIGFFFVWRSFYKTRIPAKPAESKA